MEDTSNEIPLEGRVGALAGMVWPPMRIYVAGPYSAASSRERIMNVNLAIDAGLEVMALGHYPYIAHLSHFVNERNRTNPKRAQIKLEYEDWMRLDREWLELCMGILLIGTSPGVQSELDEARNSGLTIFKSLAQIPRVGDPVKPIRWDDA